MKNDNKKLIYAEPAIMVSEVELNGFICSSIHEVDYCIEVDEIENCGSVGLDFNGDTY